jgi:hypothetical protein
MRKKRAKCNIYLQIKNNFMFKIPPLTDKKFMKIMYIMMNKNIFNNNISIRNKQIMNKKKNINRK